MIPTLPPGLWVFLGAVLVAVAIVIHAIFPRYDYRIIGDGRTMMIYDRWGGRFQRATYAPDGTATLERVLTPF